MRRSKQAIIGSSVVIDLIYPNELGHYDSLDVGNIDAHSGSDSKPSPNKPDHHRKHCSIGSATAAKPNKKFQLKPARSRGEAQKKCVCEIKSVAEREIMCVPASDRINNRHMMLMNGAAGRCIVKQKKHGTRENTMQPFSRTGHIEYVAKSMKNVFATFITHLITE